MTGTCRLLLLDELLREEELLLDELLPDDEELLLDELHLLEDDGPDEDDPSVELDDDGSCVLLLLGRMPLDDEPESIPLEDEKPADDEPKLDDEGNHDELLNQALLDDITALIVHTQLRIT